MVTYTLTLSAIQDDKRIPLYIDGVEASLTVDADSRTGAIYHADTKAFCETHNASVRRVTP